MSQAYFSDAPLLPSGSEDWVEENLPTRLRAVLARARRVVLIANNPAIVQEDFAQLVLGKDDVVVSFNTAIKSEFLSPNTFNIFVHGYHGQDFYFFGLPCARKINSLYSVAEDRCFTLLVGVTTPMSALENVAIYRDRIPLPPLLDYPLLRADGRRFAGPSTGFNAMVLFDWLRSRPGYTYDLLSLGFSNEAGTLWGGHAWGYERAWLSHSLVRAVPLRRRKWKWLLLRWLGRK